MEGVGSIILPCTTTGNLPEDTTVEWTRSDPDFMFVHVFPNTSKHNKDLNKQYRGRTSMNQDLLRNGDLSLTLKFPSDRDSGIYICTIYKDQDILRQKTVLQHVKKGLSLNTGLRPFLGLIESDVVPNVFSSKPPCLTSKPSLDCK